MKKLIGISILILVLLVPGHGQILNKTTKSKDAPNSQWNGKKVAFLGDSMTQKWKSRIVYWEYLTEMMGIEPYVYGISGHQWTGIYRQALKLKEEHGTDVDAILIFAGTNDYMHNTPMGSFYRETAKETNFNGTNVVRKFRVMEVSDTTFCGRINKAMAFLKKNYPDQQIIIMTPIHRGFATFNATNVQPEESFANALGLYTEDYVNTLKQAASVWAVPLIDLYSISGLYPMEDSQVKYFMNEKTDRLHPGSLGNYRLAKTIQYQLLSFPSTFVEKQ
ncbi:SGNH/GDSL hydrolase family protein [uncultured Sunxiuqinia sp.]|uniref:SGNH/GDSL hydrolase family protein n=1 Tax=uncultured Sunxiuqinia sp. TaxID=1573825 RepID=UPI002AA7FBEE|nr:SGNH/GDSL hydrolase family protein [uncultured Sunxiuqinia sp.]